jgi:predicted ATPase
VPRTIQDAVLRRLVRLSPAAQRSARLAAVAGRRFDFAMLQALVGEDEPTLLQHLGELVAAQLVVEESAERFAFRHALTRQAIYTQLLARERRGLHQAVAEALEQLTADSADLRLPDLAYHHYQAGNWPKVLPYAQLMGERDQAMHAPQAAVEHFSWSWGSAPAHRTTTGA